MFQPQKHLAKWRQVFVENGFKNTLILSKRTWFWIFEPYGVVQTSPACGPSTFQIMYENTLIDFQCQHFQRQHGKVLMANLLQKFIFRTNILCYHYDADIGSLKSLKTLFEKYLNPMLEKFVQNRRPMVRNIQNFELFW